MPTPPANAQRPRRSVADRLFGRGHQRVGDFAIINPQKAIARSPVLVKANAKGEPARRNFDLGWQTEAYQLVKDVGEAGFVMHLTANNVSSGDLVPKRKVDGGTEDVDDPRVLRVKDALQPPRGGLRELLRKTALHVTIAGEWWLIGTEHTEGITSLGIVWEALSVRELHIDASGKPYRSRDGGQRESLPVDNTYIARGLNSDPEFSDRADSQMRRALTACREVAKHDRVIDATSSSRVSAGILFVPDEMSFASQSAAEDDGVADVMAEEDVDPIDELTEELLVHLSSANEEDDSPARFAPLVMRGPGEHGDKIRYIELGRDFDSTAVALREKALARLARQLDAPPEILEGKSNLSGLGGGNVAETIDADLVAQAANVGALIADFYTVAFLRPMLEDQEEMTPEESSTYFFEFDATGFAVEVDEDGRAERLHAAGLISDVERVTKAGFDPSVMPDDAERRARIALRLIERNVALAPALLPLVPGFEGIDLSDLPLFRGAQPGDDPIAPSEADLVERLQVAADQAIDRALERAASRFVSKARGDSDLRARIAKVDKLDVFTTVTATELDQLGMTRDRLFGDAWDHFAPKARAWVRDHHEQAGVPAADADDLAQLITGEVCERLTDWLLVHLRRGLPAPVNGLRVPASVIEDALRQVVPAP